MLKRIAFAGLGLALLVSPLIASAQTTDVQSVIAALLAQVKALQAQIAQLQGQSSQTNCVDISGNLTLGSTGSDVTSLQNYLIGKGYLDAQYNTGYYGFLTAQAVGKLQTNLDLLTSANDSAYGITGPQTRALIACNDSTTLTNTNPTATINQVTMTTSSGTPTIGGTATGVSAVYINVSGNGQAGASQGIVPVVNREWSSVIYPKAATAFPPGTYTVSVYNGINGPLLTTGTLTVSGGTKPQFSFSSVPASGTAPLDVLFSVKGMTNETIVFGDGISAPYTNNADTEYDNWSCTAAAQNTVCSIRHRYANPGTYNVSLNDSGGALASGATITATGTPTQSLAVACHGTPYNSGTPGVAWASTPTGGAGSYTYQWTLSNDPTGSGDFSNTNQQNVLTTYGSTGQKSASVTVSDGSASASANCSANISGGTAQPSATIDQSSLTTSSLTPTITGTASGVSSVYVEITSLSSPDPTGTVEEGPTPVTVTNGRWSTGMLYGKGGFTAGKYTVSVQNGMNGPLLARDTLTLNGTSVTPSATIDQSSLSATKGAGLTYSAITGTALNVQNIILNLKSMGLGDANGYAYGMVTNGRWIDNAPLPTPGSYPIQVIDNDAGAYRGTVLATGTLTITSSPSASPTISGVTAYNTTTGSRTISITYANLPATNIQGIFLVNSTTGTNVTSMSTQGGSGSVFLLVPDASPAGTYILRVLATTNNQTLVESAPFYVGPIAGQTNGDSGNGIILSFQVAGSSNIPLGSGATLQWFAPNTSCDLLVANNPSSNYLDAYNSGAYQTQMPNVSGSFTVTPAVPDSLYMLKCQQSGLVGVKAVHVTTYASSTPTGSSADKSANLANALTALQSALKALIAKLGQ